MSGQGFGGQFSPCHFDLTTGMIPVVMTGFGRQIQRHQYEETAERGHQTGLFHSHLE